VLRRSAADQQKGAVKIIVVHMKDGTKRQLEGARVSLVWDTDDGVELHTLDDVAKLEMLGPDLQVADGKFRGMPVKGLILTDLGDTALRIDVPLPQDFARDLGEKLLSTKIKVVRHGPPKLPGQ
jgi:hypothetical protein